MGRRRRYEPTERGNPRQLTVAQHIHSRACIKRFADATGRVAVLRPGSTATFLAAPDNSIFCAKRAWDQHLEHGGLVRGVERAFHAEVDAIVKGGTVTDHDVVTAYASIWEIRAQLADRPPDDVVLRGLDRSSGQLTKGEKEVIEGKHGAFTRSGSLPGRFVAFLNATRGHDYNMTRLGGVKWGVLRVIDSTRFVCPGSPARELYLPVTPTLALIAGYRDRQATAAMVDELNLSLLGKPRRVIFGHPSDVAAFVARVNIRRGST